MSMFKTEPSKIPKVIKNNCLDIQWSNKKVWQIKAPIEKMAIADLEWQFKIPFWHTQKGRYTISPQEVIDNPNKYPDNYKRIMDSDLRHPIDIMKNRKGKWEILDGLHRLVKARLKGYTEVDVRKIPESEIGNIK